MSSVSAREWGPKNGSPSKSFTSWESSEVLSSIFLEKIAWCARSAMKQVFPIDLVIRGFRFRGCTCFVQSECWWLTTAGKFDLEFLFSQIFEWLDTFIWPSLCLRISPDWQAKKISPSGVENGEKMLELAPVTRSTLELLEFIILKWKYFCKENSKIGVAF